MKLRSQKLVLSPLSNSLQLVNDDSKVTLPSSSFTLHFQTALGVCPRAQDTVPLIKQNVKAGKIELLGIEQDAYSKKVYVAGREQYFINVFHDLELESRALFSGDILDSACALALQDSVFLRYICT